MIQTNETTTRIEKQKKKNSFLRYDFMFIIEYKKNSDRKE